MRRLNPRPSLMSNLSRFAARGAAVAGPWHAHIVVSAYLGIGETSSSVEAIGLASPINAQYKIPARFLEAGIRFLPQITRNGSTGSPAIAARCRRRA
jgi:hypothetical protein